MAKHTITANHTEHELINLIRQADEETTQRMIAIAMLILSSENPDFTMPAEKKELAATVVNEHILPPRLQRKCELLLNQK